MAIYGTNKKQKTIKDYVRNLTHEKVGTQIRLSYELKDKNPHVFNWCYKSYNKSVTSLVYTSKGTLNDYGEESTHTMSFTPQQMPYENWDSEIYLYDASGVIVEHKTMHGGVLV